MKHSFAQFIAKIVPFLIAGISIAVFIALIVLLSYVFLWGLLIGAVLFGIAYVKNKFFPGAHKPSVKKEKQGRIIDHDDIDK